MTKVVNSGMRGRRGGGRDSFETFVISSDGVSVSYNPWVGYLVVSSGKGRRSYLAVDVVGSPAAVDELDRDASVGTILRYTSSRLLRYLLGRVWRGVEVADRVSGREGFVTVVKPAGSAGLLAIAGDRTRGRVVMALDGKTLMSILARLKRARRSRARRALIYMRHIRGVLVAAAKEGADVEVPVPSHIRYTLGPTPEGTADRFVQRLRGFGNAGLALDIIGRYVDKEPKTGLIRVWYPLRYGGGRSLVLWLKKEGRNRYRVIKAGVVREAEGAREAFTEFMPVRLTPYQRAVFAAVLGRLLAFHRKRGLGAAMNASLLATSSRRAGDVEFALNYLREKGVVKLIDRDGKTFVKLTPWAFRKLDRAARANGM